MLELARRYLRQALETGEIEVGTETLPVSNPKAKAVLMLSLTVLKQGLNLEQAPSPWEESQLPEEML
jgi:hypothetical protein